MSFRAVAWALDQINGVGPTVKLVLIALAEFANDDDITWRSRNEIAARSECSVRQVDRALKTLETAGCISRERRYAWCISDSPSCAERNSHKHRSGTTYKLHLDRTAALPPPTENPIVANLATMDLSAQTQANPHTRQSGEYEENGGCDDLLVATEGRSQLPHRATIRSVNPQLNHQPDQPVSSPAGNPPRSVGRINDSTPRAAAPSGAAPPNSGDEVVAQATALVAQCLPPHLHLMDRKGLLDVAELLRERLHLGLKPNEIYRLMDQPLPENVGRLAGVVAFRLRENVALVPPALTPTSKQGEPRAVAAERVKQPFELAWEQHIWDPTYSSYTRGGNTSPRAIIEASKAVENTLRESGLTMRTWPGYWAEAVLALPHLDPEEPRDWAELTTHARQLAASRQRVLENA